MTEKTAPILKSFKALAASPDTNVKKDDSYKVPPADLHEEEGFNERDPNDPLVVAHIERLAQAYEKGQQLPPLLVRVDQGTGRVIIVDGHCRRKAALLAISRGAPLTHLVCHPFRGSDADRVACMLNTAEGLKLRPVGIARGYLRLYRMMQDVAAVAKEVHRTTQQVEAMLLLAEASTEVQSMVNQDLVSATTAIEVIRAHGDKAGEHLTQLLQKAQNNGKKKVKPSAFREWVPPRKQSSAIYASIGALVTSLKAQGVDESIINAEGSADTEALTGQVVPVEASVLVQLLNAFKEAEELKKKRQGDSNAVKQSDSTEAQ